jgi:hypothetical protein
MTDLAQPAKNVSLAPVRPSIPSSQLLATPGFGPLLVALLCVLAGQLGFITYAPYGSDAAIGIAVGAAAVVAMSQT